MRPHWVPTIVLAMLMLPVPAARAEDWPQWRGPSRDSTAPDAGLPEKLPAALTLLWKVEVGEGYSSPLVADGRVWLMVRRGEEEVFVCLDAADGSEKWATGFHVPFQMHSAALTAGPGPKGTCLLAGNLVIGFGITEHLAALDRGTGKVVWKHEFNKQFSPPWPETGASASPLLVGETVVVPIGTKNEGGPAAFDLKTGKMRWKFAGDGPSYTSPTMFDIQGTRQIITFTQDSLVGLEPSNGRSLWSVPFKTPYGQNIVEPAVVGDKIVFTGTEQVIRALRLAKGSDDGFTASPAWEIKDHSCYMSQPLVVDGHILFHSEKQKGVILRVDAADGAVLWQSPPRMGDYVSYTRTGETILVLHNDATLRAIRNDPAKYEELAHWTVADGETWAWPAFVDGRIYVKDVKNLYCWSWAPGP